MQPELDFDRLERHFRDPIQRRYEIIRPLVLFQDRTAIQRAQETQTHPETVGALKRRFEQQGILGLFPDSVEMVTAGRQRRVPKRCMKRLKGRMKPHRKSVPTASFYAPISQSASIIAL